MTLKGLGARQGFDVDAAVVRALSKEFAARESGAIARLAENVDRLGDRFWDQHGRLTRANQIWPVELELLWDHLLLAAANFKRQLWVDSHAKLERVQTASPRRPDRVAIDVGRDPPVLLTSEGPDFHSTLKKFHGFGEAPTGSALLAALWPRQHLIIDRRAFAAALMVAPDGEKWKEGHHPEAKDDQRIRPTWADYEWYRGHAKATAESGTICLREIEQAFYLADKNAASHRGTWPQYRSRIRQQFNSKNG